MANSFSLIKNEFHITADCKVIKGEDYLTRIAANELLDTARQVAERMRAEADDEYQATQEKSRQLEAKMDNAYQTAEQEGYQEGFASAQLDFAAEVNRTLIDRAAIIDRVEDSLVDMVLTSLKAILSDMDEERTIREIAIKALRNAAHKQSAKLRVHPDRVEIVQSVVDSVKEKLEGLEWIEVVGEANLRPDDCLLQTPAGILDFSLDTQLRVLREKLRLRVKKAGAS